MKNHQELKCKEIKRKNVGNEKSLRISDSIEICEVDIAGVACIFLPKKLE